MRDPAELVGARALAAAVAAAGALGGLLLGAAELSTVAWVDVAGGSCEAVHDTDPALADRCELSGLERHGGAFLLLGAAALAMGWTAGPGRSRPAAAALVAIGAVALAVALAADLPATGDAGAIGRSLEGAVARAGPGLPLEIAGALLAAAAGALRLLARDRSRSG